MQTEKSQIQKNILIANLKKILNLFQPKKNRLKIFRTCQVTSQRPLALVVNSKLNLINLILTARSYNTRDIFKSFFLFRLHTTRGISVR